MTLITLDRNTAQLPWQLASLQRKAKVPVIQSALAFNLNEASGVEVDGMRSVLESFYCSGTSELLFITRVEAEV